MKKSILSLVATLAIAGCVKNEIAAPVYELGFEPEEVVATLNDETKTSLGSTGSVLWSQDDHITVLYKGTKYAMSYKVKAEGVGTNDATFSYDATKGFYTTNVETAFTKYYGFYPALAANTAPMDADGKLQVTIPAEQTYAKESFDATAAVMTGSSTSTNIPFKNATGLLKIFLTPSVPGTPGFCKVQSITVSSASEKLLAGAAYIDADNAAVIKEDGVSAVTLSCGGAALDESESFRTYVGNAFIFALPPTVFGENDLKITINLLNADGTAREAVVKTVPQTFTVARTKIAVVPVSYDSLEDIHGGIETTSAANIAELNERLEAEATNIVLDGANDAQNTSVVFPEAAEEKDITITITGDIAAQTEGDYAGQSVIFFENAEVEGVATDGPATLTVSAPAGTVLVFNTPQSHVTINGTQYELISGRFDVNTLVIPAGVTVNKLLMEYGSASILGTVNAVEIKGTEDVFFKECVGLSADVYAVVKDHVHPDYVAVQDGSIWNIVERPTVAKVAKIGDVEYASLEDAIKAALEANDGTPVELIEDITYAANAEWTPIVFNGGTVVIDGKNHTVTGLPGMLFNKQGSGGHHLRVTNVTFDGAKINGTTGNEAVICGYADSMNELYFENVTIKNSTVTGSNYAAAFVGYAAGWNVANDGPVYQQISFKNCKVENCTITGGGSTGALMGHATGNPNAVINVEGTTVTGNTIKCTGTSTNKAGSLFGTVGNAGSDSTADLPKGLFVSANVSSNTVTSGTTAISTICGRKGSDGGRLVLTAGGSYDARPFNVSDDWASVVSGYELKDNGDGTWTVAEAPAPVGLTTQEEFVAACAAAVSGDEIVLGAGEFAIGPVDINGKTLTFKGQGAANTKIYIGNGGYDGNGGHGSSKTANMTFEDVTLDDLAADSGYLTGFTEAAGLTFRNVTFNVGFSNWGNKGGAVSFYNCTFNQATEGKYNVQELRSANNTHYLFDRCTFNSTHGRFINAYKQGGESASIEIIVKDCSFIGTNQSKAALNLKSGYSDGCNIDLYLLGTNTTTNVKNGSKTGNPLFDDNDTHATVYQGTDKGSATIIWQGGAAK